jgi:predicted nucleic acid-binding protein
VTVLLDANVRVALPVEDHAHHVAAENWCRHQRELRDLPNYPRQLMRLLIREGQSAATAQAVLSGATGDPRHEFWPDDVAHADVPLKGIIGHRQVTDAYLAQLARARGSRLATFDQAMAKLHNDVADLIPDS